MEIIGFKMREQRGFELFKNANGDITIKQIDPYLDQEALIVLTKDEAEHLQNLLSSMIEIAEDLISPILENEDGDQNDGKESRAI